MPRRPRIWIPFYKTGTLATTSLSQSDMLTTNFETETGRNPRGITIERIIGDLAIRSQTVSNSVQRFQVGIGVESQHIDTDDWPDLETATGRWMWQKMIFFTGVAHDSTTASDQRPLFYQPIDIATMRKVDGESKLWMFFNNKAAITVEYAVHVRILCVL
mgnify:CR=1 FL=1